MTVGCFIAIKAQPKMESCLWESVSGNCNSSDLLGNLDHCMSWYTQIKPISKAPFPGAWLLIFIECTLHAKILTVSFNLQSDPESWVTTMIGLLAWFECLVRKPQICSEWVIAFFLFQLQITPQSWTYHQPTGQQIQNWHGHPQQRYHALGGVTAENQF